MAASCRTRRYSAGCCDRQVARCCARSRSNNQSPGLPGSACDTRNLDWCRWLANTRDVAATDLVPESLIVYILKHSSAFEWTCLNCDCSAQPAGGTCAGKWQRSQGQTGLDFVARLAQPRHAWFSSLPRQAQKLILEVKGDRAKDRGAGINRPAYNEMTGSLAAFLLANLGRIRAADHRVYGWLVPRTFDKVTIKAFQDARDNLRLALGAGHAFMLGTFDGPRFRQEAPPELKRLADQWFESSEGGRNALLKTDLNHPRPELRDLADRLFDFRVVTGADH